MNQLSLGRWHGASGSLPLSVVVMGFQFFASDVEDIKGKRDHY